MVFVSMCRPVTLGQASPPVREQSCLSLVLKGRGGCRDRMLAAALKAHDEKAARGEVPPPPSKIPEPPLLESLTLNESMDKGATRPMYSQSLPSGGHISFVGRGPPKPRVRPSPAPSLSLPPMLELPEPSPISTSLLSSGESPEEETTGEGGDDVGGM